jgi:hypothetical protein
VVQVIGAAIDRVEDIHQVVVEAEIVQEEVEEMVVREEADEGMKDK